MNSTPPFSLIRQNLFCITVLLALMLTGCGGSSSTDTSATDATGSASEPSQESCNTNTTANTCNIGEIWNTERCACTKIGLK